MLHQILQEEAEEHNIERSKRELSKMEELLGAPDIIKDICTDIVNTMKTIVQTN